MVVLVFAYAVGVLILYVQIPKKFIVHWEEPKRVIQCLREASIYFITSFKRKEPMHGFADARMVVAVSEEACWFSHIDCVCVCVCVFHVNK